MDDLFFSNVICRYFLENTCRAGEECKFMHDVKVGILDEECWYYKLEGKCRYGRRCYYDHVDHKMDGSFKLRSKGRKSLERENSQLSNHSDQSLNSDTKSTPPALLPLCKEFEDSGVCRSQNCSAVHGGFCKTCEKYIIHPYNRYINLVHESRCKSRGATVPTLRTELLSQSKDLMCGVCLETVYEKLGKNNKRFGILSQCPHVFCFRCICLWRNRGKKTCPECRTPSESMGWSVFHVRGGETKDLLLELLGEKRCRDKVSEDGAVSELAERDSSAPDNTTDFQDTTSRP